MSSPAPRGGNDVIAKIGLAGGVVLTAALRAACSIAAWLSGLPQSAASLTAGLRLFANPSDPAAVFETPGLSPVLYWVVALVLIPVPAALAMWLVIKLRGRRSGQDVRAAPGVATAGDIAQVASPRVLTKRATTLRPTLDRKTATAADVGYLLGTSKTRQVWATVEDSMLLIGPPRSGKGLHIVINAILDAPGAVITMSTRPDNLTVTLEARRRVGPVAVFDPQRLAPGLPVGLRWSPVRGCTDPLTAMIRATGLAAAIGFGDVESGGFWEGKSRIAIQALLHAAALDGRDARSLYQWALSPAAASDAVRILQREPAAADGWADSLESMVNADSRTRDSIWQGVGSAFASLADPRVLDAVSPSPEESFDPEPFLKAKGTLYLLGTAAGAGAAAPGGVGVHRGPRRGRQAARREVAGRPDGPAGAHRAG